jgi:hypothetical protein
MHRNNATKQIMLHEQCAKIFGKTLALQCNMCYSVFSNKTGQLEITLKRKGNE